jgi:uncharacterized protein (UPF0305 family)
MIFKLELQVSNEIKKDDLVEALKKEAANIHITDIMKAWSFLLEDAKYVQENYRAEYAKAYGKSFFIRIKELKDDMTEYEDYIDLDEFKKAIKLLKDQAKELEESENFDPCFAKVYRIISLYTTFVLDEPIHVVGTPFPGGFKVEYKEGTYYCPVKEKQKNNPGAVCGFCIAEQDPELIQ